MEFAVKKINTGELIPCESLEQANMMARWPYSRDNGWFDDENDWWLYGPIVVYRETPDDEWEFYTGQDQLPPGY